MQVVAEHLSVEEVAGIKDMFHMMDTNDSGNITFDELKVGLQKIGQQVPDPDVQMLMEAVSTKYLMNLFERLHIFSLYVYIKSWNEKLNVH